jgi:hypothetical protein
MSTLHDDVKAALDELQAGGRRSRAGRGPRAGPSVQLAARGGAGDPLREARPDFEAPEIKAGAGAIEDPLHPETAATEAQPTTAADLEAQAQREPDPTVRANIRATAADQQAGDELSGKALDDRAAELDIEGRSAMSADEKRKAIAKAEQSQ